MGEGAYLRQLFFSNSFFFSFFFSAALVPPPHRSSFFGEMHITCLRFADNNPNQLLGARCRLHYYGKSVRHRGPQARRHRVPDGHRDISHHGRPLLHPGGRRVGKDHRRGYRWPDPDSAGGGRRRGKLLWRRWGLLGSPSSETSLNRESGAVGIFSDWCSPFRLSCGCVFMKLLPAVATVPLAPF